LVEWSGSGTIKDRFTIINAASVFSKEEMVAASVLR